MAAFLLIAGTSGLTLPDFAFALHSATGSDSLPAGLGVSEIEAGRYLVSGVPEYPRASMRVLTWETPLGNGARALPEGPGTPPFVVLALRTSGAAAGLVPELWRSGVRQGSLEADLVITETANGDARIAGLPEGHGEWSLVVPWAGGALVTTWHGQAAATSLVAETIERRLLSRHLRTNWTLCPVAIPGVSFDPAAASDVAPFTVAEVRDSVGYLELSFREVDSFHNDATSGLATVAPGIEASVSSVYTLTRARFTFRLPGKVAGREALVETYTDRVRDLFLGLRIAHTGPPRLILRQLATAPPRLWRDTDEGDWRRRDLDVLIRRWERKEHAGVQEVTL